MLFRSVSITKSITASTRLKMNKFLVCIALFFVSAHFSESFVSSRFSGRKYSGAGYLGALTDENAEKPKDSLSDSEMSQVNKGLTHIKYNKYAPTAEEAAGMTDEQFRGTIYRRMVCRDVP